MWQRLNSFFKFKSCNNGYRDQTLVFLTKMLTSDIIVRSFSRSVFQAKFFFNPQRMKIYLSLESLDKIRSKMLDIKEQLVKQKQDLQQKKQDSGTPKTQQNYGIYMYSKYLIRV